MDADQRALVSPHREEASRGPNDLGLVDPTSVRQCRALSGSMGFPGGIIAVMRLGGDSHHDRHDEKEQEEIECHSEGADVGCVEKAEAVERGHDRDDR